MFVFYYVFLGCRKRSIDYCDPNQAIPKASIVWCIRNKNSCCSKTSSNGNASSSHFVDDTIVADVVETSEQNCTFVEAVRGIVVGVHRDSPIEPYYYSVQLEANDGINASILEVQTTSARYILY